VGVFGLVAAVDWLLVVLVDVATLSFHSCDPQVCVCVCVCVRALLLLLLLLYYIREDSAAPCTPATRRALIAP
jgi:nicotinamide riboside transporter PnuC